MADPRWWMVADSSLIVDDIIMTTLLSLLKTIYVLANFLILYNDNTCAVIGRCPWSIRGQIHGWRHGKLFLTVLLNMVRGFENVCEIISDKSKWKLIKNLAPELFTKKKMEKQRQKEPFTTWECQNYKKSSQQLPSCVIATRLAVLRKYFSHYSALSKKRRWKFLRRNCIQVR